MKQNAHPVYLFRIPKDYPLRWLVISTVIIDIIRINTYIELQSLQKICV